MFLIVHGLVASNGLINLSLELKVTMVVVLIARIFQRINASSSFLRRIAIAGLHRVIMLRWGTTQLTAEFRRTIPVLSS